MMRILVATDGSDASGRAVELAARITKELKGHLKIIHVITVRDFSLNNLKITPSGSMLRPARS